MLMHYKPPLIECLLGSSKGFLKKKLFQFFQISLEINPNQKIILKHLHKEAYIY